MLPNKKTVAQVVNQVVQSINQTMSDTEQGGGDPFAAGLVDYFFDVNSNGPIDFKSNFRGQANPGFLGDAGNFPSAQQNVPAGLSAGKRLALRRSCSLKRLLVTP